MWVLSFDLILFILKSLELRPMLRGFLFNFLLLCAYSVCLWVEHHWLILLMTGVRWQVLCFIVLHCRARVTWQLYLWGFVRGWSDKYALVRSTKRGNVWNLSLSWLQTNSFRAMQQTLQLSLRSWFKYMHFQKVIVILPFSFYPIAQVWRAVIFC